jgi:hypothetical protein
MPYRRKCGCLYRSLRDASVRSGVELHGYRIEACAEHKIANPPGEKIRSAEGGAMEGVPATGQPPVGASSPLFIFPDDVGGGP